MRFVERPAFLNFLPVKANSMRVSLASVRGLVACPVLLALAGAAAAENWPQWRGPNYDGISSETGLPTEWSADKNLAWKFDMPGMGSSTPAIWGSRIFLTSQDGSDLVVLCVSTAGKELWRHKLGTATKPARGSEGNGASASASTNGKHVYAFVGSGELACLDFDGKEVWKFNTHQRYGKVDVGFGLHSTPVLDRDRLYLQIIHPGGAWVIAVDAATGKDIWKVKRESDGRAECEHSYASPTLWRKGKDAYLITHGNDYAIAHRLEDGSEIWRVGGLNPKDSYNSTLRFVSSPLATPNLIIIPSAKNGPVVALKPDAMGLVMAGNTAEVWRMPHNTPDVPSPLLYDGLVYLCQASNNLTCVDAKTGEQKYNQRIWSSRYRASPTYAGGHIYLAARDGGVITVVKPGPQFEQVAVNKLPDEFTASPAISGGRIYLRGFKALYAISTDGK
jgi:outer membrane protein assembly factor BamB